MESTEDFGTDKVTSPSLAHRRNMLGAHLAAPLSLATFIVIWWFAAALIANQAILPTPLAVAAALTALTADGNLVANAIPSLLRLGIGFLLAGFVGVPIGIGIALSDVVEDFFDPFVELVRPISGIAWIPLVLFVFGVGDVLPITIIFYVALFPFVLNTAAGVRGVDPAYVRAARTMGCGELTIVRRIVLPAALPAILTGARLAAGGGLMALVAAEFIGAPSGIGFAIQWYANLLRTADMLAYVVAVGALGFLSDRTLRWTLRLMAPWAVGMRDD